MEVEKMGFWESGVGRFVRWVGFVPIMIAGLAAIEVGSVYSLSKAYAKFLATAPELVSNRAIIVAAYVPFALFFAFGCFALVAVAIDGVCPRRRIGLPMVSIAFLAWSVAALWVFPAMVGAIARDAAVCLFVTKPLWYFRVLYFVGGAYALVYQAERMKSSTSA